MGLLLVIGICVCLSNILMIGLITREILRDCQTLLKTVIRCGCEEGCSIMNSVEDIEYLCSCHTTNKQVFADDG